MANSSYHEGLITAIRQSVPRRPGVYSFYDQSGKNIYTGKSVDLRQRMLSYFYYADQARLHNRIKRMVSYIQSFDYYETATELLALVLEDTIIKRDHPSYNIRQHKSNNYRFLVLTDDPYPACRVVHDQGDAAGTAFGPFQGRQLMDNILSIVHRHFRLRSCKDPHPHRKCLHFELGVCTGPCKSNISVERYAETVGRVIDFLSGCETWIADRLKEEMARFAEALNYEKAAELRTQISFCKDFCARQQFFHEFKTKTLFIHQQGDQQWLYRFTRGNLAEVTPHRSGPNRFNAIPDLVFQALSDVSFMIDRASLLYGWLSRHGASCRSGFA